MPDTQVEPDVVSESDLHTLEVSLEKLWEKARRVSDLLLRFKEENQGLQGRIAELERAESQLRADLRSREQELERLSSELTRLQANGSQLFSQDEKEALKAKIQDLISKINSRL
ncbi:MAG: hypothetical protein L0Y80_04640 [Ignavibacteriae bacterium]|nr:hypothetical protein [Ignavibacteriota bacterium]